MTIRAQNLSRVAGLLAMLALFFLLTTAYVFAEILILPLLLGEAPSFVENFLGLLNGASRFAAVPVGVALVGLGHALWSQRQAAGPPSRQS